MVLPISHVPGADVPLDGIVVQTLAQFGAGQDWQLQLAQSRAHHTLIWTTRGQGRVLLDGVRRGLGPHNAVWIPAGVLFALELGAQGAGLVVRLPASAPQSLPLMPHQMRIRDAQVQSELTGLIENAARELQLARALHHDALEGYAALISVWLRRQAALDAHLPEPRKAAARLSARFCQMVSTEFAAAASMGNYATALGVTPTHLTRAVKSATGKTAAEILTERILFEARVLLRDTREPAQGIAKHLGFGSAAYFTRFITQHTGVPPSKLRD